MLNIPFCLKKRKLYLKTSTGAFFEMLRQEKRIQSFQSQNSIAQRYKNLFFAFKHFLLIGFERIIYIECFVRFFVHYPKFVTPSLSPHQQFSLSLLVQVKTTKNNNSFWIDFFIFSSLLKTALHRFLFLSIKFKLTHSL